MRKFSVFVLAFMLVLTGCFGENSTEKAEKSNDGGVTVIKEQQSNIKMQFNGGTVLDIKKKYGTDQDKAIMPLYNVEHDKSFTFRFKADMSELNYFDIISVHTDIKATEDSKIGALINPDSYSSGPTTLTVKPSTGVLRTKGQEEGSTWGRAAIYYIKITYDMDMENPTKLEKPMIIPFTIK